MNEERQKAIDQILTAACEVYSGKTLKFIEDSLKDVLKPKPSVRADASQTLLLGYDYRIRHFKTGEFWEAVYIKLLEKEKGL